MKVFLISLLLLALGVAGMAIGILLKKDGKFPDGEIGRNKELRRQGIRCAKEEEMDLWKKKRQANAASGCRCPDTCPESGCDGCV